MDQRRKKTEGRSFRKWLRRRAAIEPLIGHMKNDGGPKRNHLLGKQGDEMNALLMGIGFNLRKILSSIEIDSTNLFFGKIVRTLTSDAKVPAPWGVG